MSLMRLKVPGGFAVTYNKFHDVDPITDETTEDLLSNWGYFTEDILQISKLSVKNGKFIIPERHFIIDLGWYPDGSPNGEYRLVLVDYNKEWNEIKELSSRSRYEIRDTLEIWLRELNENQSRFLRSDA
ncbi:hypothetical protein D3C75_822720 [compost metagenome]